MNIDVEYQRAGGVKAQQGGGVATAQISAEQLADLNRLEGMAAEGDPAPGVENGGAEVEAAPAVDPAESWAMIPAIVGSTLSIAFPELQRVYSPDACRNWGAAMVPVADKYGWSADGLVGPEIALFAASLPFVLGTAQVIRVHKAERAEQEKRKAEESKPAPVIAPVAPVEEAAPVDSGKTVTFGAPAPVAEKKAAASRKAKA